MKVLLVYPQFPVTFWSFKHALRFISKKTTYPPLGLLTVAAMLPSDWQKKLVDMNVTRLSDEDIQRADLVLISAMGVQKESVREVIRRCRELGVKTVAGGPLFTMEPDDYPSIDHLVLGEAETVLPAFLADLAAGHAARIYRSETTPDICTTPLPSWSLINMKHYSSMSIQYSRGCPFNCEFCDIVLLNGRRPRTKAKDQLLAELEALYSQGWRAGVFIVDDNFIGNKKKLKEEILPAVIEWRKGKKHAPGLNTETSIDLADDDELIRLMVEAGFETVFIGIETPNEDSLAECAKNQNRNRDLETAVRKLHNLGLEVQGGFIVGFDADPVSIFKSQINFIQKSGIVTAMVGLLNAPPGTRLYHRLKKENRIVGDFDGSNTECNFVPKMNYHTLITGYKNILKNIYSNRQYYERINTFLKDFKPRRSPHLPGFSFRNVITVWKVFWILGVWEKGKRYYWRLFFSTALKRPRSFPVAMKLAIYGYHFRRVVDRYVGKTLGAGKPG
ncbi:MAG: B12-binding domain-containing radical SAM protein [Chloroflexi bacterium RBG_13_57_8]|nr:MAG: B12-binding domain-containing radical SAM protein [Chloroflexi bacterium RBG_13_57_8]